jgi:hypothetical protein
VGSQQYTTRLWWYGSRGAAKLWGVERQLSEPPTVLGTVVDAIDYVPEIGLKQIQPRGDRWRDLRDDEVKACDELLHRLCEDSEW